MTPRPFDQVIAQIQSVGYHNHRRTAHSNLLTDQILADLKTSCPALAGDAKSGKLSSWPNTPGPDGRNTDLLFGAAQADKTPDLQRIRLLIENKSVVTAHRNRFARYQDIEREVLATHSQNPKTIVLATLLVGTCAKVLNVPDCVSGDPRYSPQRFKDEVLPRLSTGDQRLWAEFPHCVSNNTAEDPLKTVEKFQSLPIRGAAETHRAALDFLLIVPVAINNVDPPRVMSFHGIDPVTEYSKMIDHICWTYAIRWHQKP